MTPASTITIVIFTLVAIAIGARIALVRGWRIGVPFGFAIGMLGAACLDPHIAFLGRPNIALLVDASPSTRGMWFRDPQAIAEINTSLAPFANVLPFRFADGTLLPLTLQSPVDEIDSSRTTLPPIVSDAVVLLSDGQFADASIRVPTFAIVDPAAAPSGDARVVDASLHRGTLSVRIANSGSPRELRWPDGSRAPIATGESTVTRIIDSTQDAELAVALDPKDRWPENDRLIVPINHDRSDRLWIGESPPTGFAVPASSNLADLLHASVIVLNDVPIESLSESTQNTLARYVRDLGGSLIMGGGSHSLSAGGYGNTILDSLSPLASIPPSPSNDLFVIVDSSGSMASPLADGTTKLDAAVTAMAAIDAIVPKKWTLRAGSIARDLRWWTADTSRIHRPADLAANGPTNIAAAIQAVRDVPASNSKRLILISDGQTDEKSLAAIRPNLADSKLTIDWLALPPADGNGILAQIVRSSGGQLILSRDTTSWRADAQTLARAALAKPMVRGAFALELPPVGNVQIEQINQTFLREGATTIGSIVLDAVPTPAAAQWNVGLGKVTTLAFKLDADRLGTFALANARSPGDPRFKTRLISNTIDLEARDANGPMNALAASVSIDGQPLPLSQIGPGRYQFEIARSNRPRIATILLNNAAIESISIPSRAPAEFDSIGINLESLTTLAQATGGKLIDRSQVDSLRKLIPKQRSGVRVPALVLAMLGMVIALVMARQSKSDGRAI